MKKPCKFCPFLKNNEDINLKNGIVGGSSIFVYIGQAQGPFKLNCHKDKNYRGKEDIDFTLKNASECVGAANYRANIGISGLMPNGILKGKKDDSCFKSPAEFASHYTGTPEYFWEMHFTPDNLKKLLIKELNDVQVTRYDLKTLEKL